MKKSVIRIISLCFPFFNRLCLRIFGSLVILLLFEISILSQAPQVFKYQAVVRSDNGEVISNQSINLRLSILQGNQNGTPVYSEIHSIMTNDFGLVNLEVGSGTAQSGNFQGIDWSSGPYFLKAELDSAGGNNFTDLGTAQLLSVPYALYARKAANTGAIGSGSWVDGAGKVTTEMKVGIGTDNPIGMLAVQGNSNMPIDTPLFEVKDKNGNTVFAVYEDGAVVTINEGSKGSRGGFAVGGRKNVKGEVIEDIMRVTPDSVRIYINDNPIIKGGRGGFAVGGRKPAKSDVADYFQVTPDSTRVYVNIPTGKGGRGGFAVGGRRPSKGAIDEYFNISSNDTNDILTINPSKPCILWYPRKEAFLTGRVLVLGPQYVGFNSMATGFESQASGNWSQAFGYKSNAWGTYSTAIGKQALAEDTLSFAFGNNARAGASESFAFGSNSWALSKGSLAFGYNSQAYGEDSYSFGTGSQTNGKGSFAMGFVGRDSAGLSTGNTLAMGDYATAIGMGAQSTGKGAFSIGIQTKADGYYSLAMGYKSKTNDWYATAIGNKAAANGEYSIALGDQAMTNGWHAASLGYQAAANESYSTAIGYKTVADYMWATAIGTESRASGQYSIAIGYKSRATGLSSMVMGHESLCSGQSSVALGYQTEASGLMSTSMGAGTVASGQTSTAMGNTTKASGNSSFAAGNTTTASGDYSIAIGVNIKASGLGSAGLGAGTTAEGLYSFAMGGGSRSSGGASAAIGYYAHSKSAASFVCGSYNDTTCSSQDPNSFVADNPLFVVGNGNSADSLSNALTILRNGKTAIGHSSPTQMLDVNGSARFRSVASSAGGTPLVIAADGTIYTQSSDVRLKTNLTPIEGALEKLSLIHGYRFNWKNDLTQREDIGFIAQEMIEAFPELVQQNKTDGYYGINYSQFTAVLAEAIKQQNHLISDQQQQIESVKAENQRLKIQNEGMEKRINQLENLQTEVNEIKELMNAKAGAK